MSILEFFAYLGGLIAITSPIAFFDLLVPPHARAKLGTSLQRGLMQVRRPLTRAGYFFILFGSVFFTLLILIINGLWIKWDDSGHFLQSLKSDGFITAVRTSGPLVLALLFKLFIWDYVLAVKSAYVFDHALFYAAREVPGKGLALLLTLALFDVWLSSAFTAAIVTRIELWQMGPLAQSASGWNWTKPLESFFNELNLFAKTSIQFAHYWLNGALLYYFCYLLSPLSGEANLDWITIQRTPFTVIAGLFVIFGTVILACIFVGAKF